MRKPCARWLCQQGHLAYLACTAWLQKGVHRKLPRKPRLQAQLPIGSMTLHLALYTQQWVRPGHFS